MRLADLRNATDDELSAEFQRQAGHTVISVASIQDEFQCRATERLIHATQQVEARARELSDVTARLTTAAEQLVQSSYHLEKLTRLLIVLTVLLLVAALPPAIEAVSSYAAAHRVTSGYSK